MTSRFLGSWPAIIGLWVFCGAWWLLGLSMTGLLAALSIFALTLTQLVLRDTDRISERQERKLDEIVRGTDADNAVLEEA